MALANLSDAHFKLFVKMQLSKTDKHGINGVKSSCSGT